MCICRHQVTASLSPQVASVATLNIDDVVTNFSGSPLISAVKVAGQRQSTFCIDALIILWSEVYWEVGVDGILCVWYIGLVTVTYKFKSYDYAFTTTEVKVCMESNPSV